MTPPARPPVRVSLLTGILLTTFAIVMASSALLAILLWTSLSREISQQAIGRGEEIVAGVRIAVEQGRELGIVERQLRALGSREEVLEIALVDVTGRRLLSGGPRGGDRLSDETVAWVLAPPGVYEPGKGPVRHRLSDDRATLSVASPVTLPDGGAGGVWLVMSMEEVNRALAAARQGLLISLVVDTTVLFAGFLLFLAIVLVRPILRMVRTVDLVREGDYSARVGPVRGGELNQLAAGIDGMVGSLEEKIEGLTKANTALLAAREELIAAEKLATVGRIAAGLAHEVGNPLAALIGYVKIMDAQGSPERRRLYLERMSGELERIHGIIGELVHLSRPAEWVPGATDVADVVRRTAVLLRDHPDLRGVSLVVDTPETLVHPALEPGRLQQVLVNLVLNAGQAMPGGGTLKVRALADPGGVTITVEDTGPGIPPSVAGKIFEPFFTTKEPGKGLGLGLSISRHIVTLMGGTIQVASSPGAGSLFTLRFPTAEGGA
jgi:signal transduction histidine kinase